MLKEFIERISKELSLTPPDLQEEGTYQLTFDKELRISLRENTESGITLFAVLAPLPATKTEDFLQEVLAANLFGKETGRAFLGVDKEGKQLTLTQFISPGVAYKEFFGFLEDFVNYTESWRLEAEQFSNVKPHA